jgi:hypothetical protein
MKLDPGGVEKATDALFNFRQFYSLPPEYGLPSRKCGEAAPGSRK